MRGGLTRAMHWSDIIDSDLCSELANIGDTKCETDNVTMADVKAAAKIGLKKIFIVYSPEERSQVNLLAILNHPR
jgi:hypothetical protein